ncbi:hypothetical protein DPMN_161402 [Dreissena polymorpha]|uniref:Uncharacterized protein n=1 Tax=Dreissena polymorpha TaxID=45954 RepID=A0A9D4EPW7_DREPO|nr:hypothetical protein DPMN_161402 [Dreissena polymorpha]
MRRKPLKWRCLKDDEPVFLSQREVIKCRSDEHRDITSETPHRRTPIVEEDLPLHRRTDTRGLTLRAAECPRVRIPEDYDAEVLGNVIVGI